MNQSAQSDPAIGQVAVSQWPDEIFQHFKDNDIRQVGYVPDAGHARLIRLCTDDTSIRNVPLTSEIEGIALAAGAWLGGQRSALLMQSSGIGNCINMISLIRSCRFPLLMLAAMRGEWGEINPWQVPISSSAEEILKACDFITYRCTFPQDVGPTIAAAIDMAFQNQYPVVVFLSQRLTGSKKKAK